MCLSPKCVRTKLSAEKWNRASVCSASLPLLAAFSTKLTPVSLTWQWLLIRPGWSLPPGLPVALRLQSSWRVSYLSLSTRCQIVLCMYVRLSSTSALTNATALCLWSRVLPLPSLVLVCLCLCGIYALLLHWQRSPLHLLVSESPAESTTCLPVTCHAVFWITSSQTVTCKLRTGNIYQSPADTDCNLSC